MVSTGQLASLSVQQFADCCKLNSGCNGGLMDYAPAYYKSALIKDLVKLERANLQDVLQ